jgi:hypothetical protein
MPRSSSPRRPARPLIWMYSPELTMRKSSPSYCARPRRRQTRPPRPPARPESARTLRTLVNTTVLAGMFRPMEKVSVEKRHLQRPSWKRISITSLRMGSSPPWWMPGRAPRAAQRQRPAGHALRSGSGAHRCRGAAAGGCSPPAAGACRRRRASPWRWRRSAESAASPCLRVDARRRGTARGAAAAPSVKSSLAMASACASHSRLLQHRRRAGGQRQLRADERGAGRWRAAGT